MHHWLIIADNSSQNNNTAADNQDAPAATTCIPPSDVQDGLAISTHGGKQRTKHDSTDSQQKVFIVEC